MEYGYAVIGNKIVISGRSIADTILAIDKFTADIIDGYTSGSTELVFENNKYICEYDHKFDSISINGTDISEYDIVYKKTKAFHENEIVERLQDSIGRLCGFMPKGILMNTTSNIKTKQIVITDSPALTDEIKANKNALLSGVDVASKSVIVVDENVIWLSGETLAGLLDTVEKFVSALESSADGKVTLESGVSDISNPAIKVMSYNVYVSAATAGMRRKGVAKTIFDYAPDIIGVQEASVGWMTMLKADIGSVYDSVGKGRESMNNNPSSRTNGEHCAIFYNKEKYKVLETNTFWLSETPNVQSKHDESEYIRIMTYAIFERKSDGFKFMMVNTHLDFKESVKAYQVTKMLEKIEETGFKGLTFITGDFNTNISSGSYKLMLEAGFENTFNAAYISSEPNINSMIDFCMVRDLEGDYIVSNHHVANDEIDKNNNGEFPSDHCAVDASIIPILKKD